MDKTIYDEYWAGGSKKEELLRKIRELALSARLQNYNVRIANNPSTGLDDPERYADRFAQRMMVNRHLQAKVLRDIEIHKLADPEFDGFLSVDNRTHGVLGQRASKAIRGVVPAVLGKVERRARKESHFKNAENEVTSDAGASESMNQSDAAPAQKSFASLLEVVTPIDRSMPLSRLDGQNIKGVLDLENSYGETALELLVAKTFIEEVRPPDEKALKNEHRRRRSRLNADLRHRQVKLAADC